MEQEQQFLVFSYIAPPQSKNIHPFWFSKMKKFKIPQILRNIVIPDLSVCVGATKGIHSIAIFF